MRQLIAAVFLNAACLIGQANAQVVASDLFFLQFQPGSARVDQATAQKLENFKERMVIVRQTFEQRFDVQFVLVSGSDNTSLDQRRTDAVRAYFSNAGLDIDLVRPRQGIEEHVMVLQVHSTPVRELWACPWQVRLQFPPSAGGGGVVVASRPRDTLSLTSGVSFGFTPNVSVNASSEIFWRGSAGASYVRLPLTRRIATPGEVLLQLTQALEAQSRGTANTAAGSDIARSVECSQQIQPAPQPD